MLVPMSGYWWCSLMWSFNIFVIIGACYCLWSWNYSKPVSVKEKHVVITGGSSGIGKSVAIELAKRGAHVTIVARNKARLELAALEIAKYALNYGQTVNYLQLDVTSDYFYIKTKLEELEESFGPIFMLVNCAGSAICKKLDDLTPEDIKRQFSLNTVGSILPTKAVLRSMKNQNCGHIILTASQAAYVGLYGCSAYCASKFALRGFGEALQMEVEPYGISVTIAFPPDTDTPGFVEENKIKPKETKLITESSGPFSPDMVAKAMIDHALAGKFSSNIGLDGFMLENLCFGMAPSNSFKSILIQVLSVIPLRIIGLVYQSSFKSIINEFHKSRLASEEKKKKF